MGQYWKLVSLDAEQMQGLGKLGEAIYDDNPDILAALLDPGLLPLTTEQLRRWIRYTSR